jgi:hypothetical protein
MGLDKKKVPSNTLIHIFLESSFTYFLFIQIPFPIFAICKNTDKNCHIGGKQKFPR